MFEKSTPSLEKKVYIPTFSTITIRLVLCNSISFVTSYSKDRSN